MCDVLIVTSAFGNGHISVATAVMEQLKEKDPSLNVVVEDIMNISSPKTKDVYFDIYTLLTSKHPSVYNFFYKIKKDIPNNAMDDFLYSVYMKRVAEYIKKKKPKLIVSTFPLGSGFVSKIKEDYGISIPLITTITDVVDSWEWIHKKTDMYFVPCKDIGQRLIEKGISKDKIRVTGIPVKKEFLQTTGRHKEKKQVLIMGGVMTELGLNREALLELNELAHTKTIVVTGKNKELYKKLSMGSKFDNIEILGYTENVAQLMETSDLVVTKPGGVTLFEAINKGTPVILKNSLVGQEEQNLNFMRSMGIGILIDDTLSLRTQIEAALDNPDGLNHIRKKLEAIRMEIQPAKVGEYALELM